MRSLVLFIYFCQRAPYKNLLTLRRQQTSQIGILLPKLLFSPSYALKKLEYPWFVNPFRHPVPWDMSMKEEERGGKFLQMITGFLTGKPAVLESGDCRVLLSMVHVYDGEKSCFFFFPRSK